MNYQELVDRITAAILDNIRVALDKYTKCDKTYKGKVTEIVWSKRDSEKRTGKYKVLINDITYTATSSISCEEGDYVWICIPQGNEKDMFIVSKTK